jgi:hypothetical protein
VGDSPDANGAESGSENEDSDVEAAEEHPPPSARKSRVSSQHLSPGNFDDLDKHVQEIAWGAVLAYTREVVRCNPLSDKIPVTVLQETISEIAMHVRAQVTLPLLIAAGSKRWQLPGGEWEREGEVDVPGEVEACVKKTLSIPKGDYKQAASIHKLL